MWQVQRVSGFSHILCGLKTILFIENKMKITIFFFNNIFLYHIKTRKTLNWGYLKAPWYQQRVKRCTLKAMNLGIYHAFSQILISD